MVTRLLALWSRCWYWYLDRYHLVELIEVPPISGAMSPPLIGPLTLAGSDAGGPLPSSRGGAYRVMRRRR